MNVKIKNSDGYKAIWAIKNKSEGRSEVLQYLKTLPFNQYDPYYIEYGHKTYTQSEVYAW